MINEQKNAVDIHLRNHKSNSNKSNNNNNNNDNIIEENDLIIVKYSADKGKHVIAKTQIPKGDYVSFREKPFVATVNFKDPFEKEICHRCFIYFDNKDSHDSCSCQQCKSVFYCSEQCKEHDQYSHNLQCGFLKKLLSASLFDHEIKTLMKMIVKILVQNHIDDISDSNNNNNSSSPLNSTTLLLKDIFKLVSNKDRFTSQRIGDFVKAFRFIEKSCFGGLQQDHPLLKSFGVVDSKSLEFQNKMIELMCILECNAHEIGITIPSNTNTCSYRYCSIGAGLYYTSSLFNHSCQPNISKIIEPGQSYGNHTMLAFKDIEMGEEICFNYIPISLAFDDRQTKLLYSYFFKCACPACLHVPKKTNNNKKNNNNNNNNNQFHNRFLKQYLCKKETCNGIITPFKVSPSSVNNTLTSLANDTHEQDIEYSCNICNPHILGN
ncbi:hypothetical protein CYY_002101 [Polysphondylium violaceum]|uniref:SET domain-containing protein n=1 Tax=Polysphondylium violaceum TaxID=133409 RepID=A0A8J4PZS5_9MYCE|nr:hypothetical protein CYY_002101 [Polysphondylium violaceum]